jgi:hypothetical protein
VSAVVWKFPLRSWSAFIDMPAGASILSCGEQDGELCVWALCDPDAPKVGRYVAAINTGRQMPSPTGEFIGTVQMPNGIVWHLFESHEGV